MKKSLLLLTVLLLAAFHLKAQDVDFNGGWYSSDLGTFSTNYTAVTNTGATADGLNAPNYCGPFTVVSQTGQPVISEAATPEIVSLAANLQNDPKRIFDYVHNNIKYVHYFGSKKGAFLTMLEGSGNDFDQCALFAALIRAASTNSSVPYTVHFQFGLMEIPYTNSNNLDLMHWLGISWTPAVPSPPYYGYGKSLWQSLNSLNHTRNFPDLENGNNYCIIDVNDSTDNNYLFQRLWVRLTIGTTNYYLDPAFKISVQTPGIDVTNAMNLNLSNVFSSTESGATVTSLYVQHLNYTNLASQIKTNTANLLTYLSNNPNRSVEQVIGGYDVQQSTTQTFPCLNLQPYSGSFNDEYTGYTNTMPILEWDNIPTNFMTSIHIQVDNINVTYPMPSLMARKLSLTFTNISGNYESQISFDDVVQVTSTGNVGNTTVTMTNTIVHPAGVWNYTSNNVTFTYYNSQNDILITTGLAPIYYRTAYGYVTTYGFDDVHQLLLNRENKLNALLQQNLNPTNRSIVTETLNIIGLSWLNQTYLQDTMLGAEKGDAVFFHHRAGRVAAENTYYVDLRINDADDLIRTDLRQNTATLRSQVAQYAQFIASGLEHGVIEQIQTNLSASTMKMLFLANQNGQKLIVSQLYVDGSGDVGPLLNAETYQPYGASKSTVLGYLTAGNVLLPSGINTVGTYNGYGAAIINGGNIAMLINGANGAFNGGYGGTPAPIDGGSADTFTFTTSPTFVFFGPPSQPYYLGADPINVLDGSFSVDSVDLTAGQSDPRGFKFARHYDSNRRNVNAATMADGWIHNYIINAVTRSDPDAALGRNTAQEAAAFMTAQRIGFEMFTYNPTSTNKPLSECWSIAALCAEWAVDNLKSNAVNVTLGTSSVQFIKEPDGSYTPPAGITVSLTKSNGTYALQLRHGNLYQFNTNGFLTSIIDQYSQSNQFYYNSNNLLTNITDWKGRILTFLYTNTPYTNLGMRLVTVTNNGTGRAVNYGYSTNANGQLDLTLVADPLGFTNGYIYDTNHQITATFNALGQTVTSNNYDGFGHVIRQYSQGLTNQMWQGFWAGVENILVDPMGGQQEYFYDSKFRLIGMQDALSNFSQTFYDGQDHAIMTISPLNETNQAIYDGNHNVLKTIDPLGFTNGFVFDSSFNLLKSFDALGHSNVYNYNSKFQLLAATNAVGDWFTKAYDPAIGVLSSRTDAAGQTTFGYDIYGQQDTVTYPSGLGTVTTINNILGDIVTNINARGFVTTFQYDLRRELTNSIATNSVTASTAYDAVGNVQTTKDPNGNVVTKTWSATRQLISTIWPITSQGTPVATNAYDSRDWLAISADPLNYKVLYSNDLAHRLIATVDPLLRTNTLAYNSDGRNVSSTDAALKTTFYNYDARGQLIGTTNAATNTVFKSFDGNGNQLWLTNHNTNVWRFFYDAANRLTNTTTPAGKSNYIVFNHAGLVASRSDFLNQVTSFTYDGRKRLSSSADALGTNIHLYDANNNLTALIQTNSPLGYQALQWGYDAFDRTVAFTNANTNVIQYGYDNNGNLTSLFYPGKGTVTYGYDGLNRLTTVTDWVNRVTIYTYDLDSRVTSITRPNGTLRTINYDSAGQTTNIIEQAASHAPIAFFKLNWNNAGRIQSEFMAPTNRPYTPPTRTLGYDADNRLTNFNTTAVVNDNNGNMTSGPLLTNTALVTYVYDARNRLTSAGGLNYEYDPAGTRVGISSNSFTNVLIVDPKNSQVLIRIKNGVTNYYVYGLGLIYEEDDTATSTNTLTYHYDYRGSTIALTDTNGFVTDQIQYSPYGMTTFRKGTNDTPFLYNGRYGVQTDANGLLFMRARYYNPYICRFINADPSGWNGGLNFYAYANGDPVSLTDPFGLGAVGDTGIAGAIVDNVGEFVGLYAEEFKDLGKSAALGISLVGAIQEALLNAIGVTSEDLMALGPIGGDIEGEIAGLKSLGALADIEDTGLFRVGAAGSKGLPQTMETVVQHAEQAGIGLDGVSVKIVSDAPPNFYGWANPSGTEIHLYPAAFSDSESLITTLGHERTHVYQYQTFGSAVGASTTSMQLFENAAYETEGSFYQYYLSKGGGN